MKALTIKDMLTFEECEARQKAIEAKTWKDGSVDPITEYVNAYFSGDMEALVAKSKGKFYKKGGTELKKEYQQGEKIWSTLTYDEFLGKVLKEDGQRDFKVSGTVANYPFEETVSYFDDSRQVGVLIHLKILKSLTNELISPYFDNQEVSQLKDAFKRYGYDMEFWLKAHLVSNEVGKKCQTFALALSKEDEPDKELVYFSEDDLEAGKKRLLHLLSLYGEVERGERDPKRCEHCDYCRNTKVLKSSIKFEDLH